MARKSFRKRVIRKIRRTLRMDEADEIIRQEFTDSKNNKHIFIMDVKPHSPNKPTIESSVEYKDDK